MSHRHVHDTMHSLVTNGRTLGGAKRDGPIETGRNALEHVAVARNQIQLGPQHARREPQQEVPSLDRVSGSHGRSAPAKQRSGYSGPAGGQTPRNPHYPGTGRVGREDRKEIVPGDDLNVGDWCCA